MRALKQYLPYFGMVLVAILQVLYTAYSDGKLSLLELLNVGIALGGAITVYVTPHLQGLSWLKPAVAALTAFLMVFVDAISSGLGTVSAQTWIMGLIQLIGVVVVWMTQGNVPVTTSKEPPAVRQGT